MRASVFVWFSFAHFQLQPVPERLQHPGCYQFEQDVWSELSSADIWFFSPNIHPCPPLGCQVKARTPHNVCMRCKTNSVPGKLCYACPQQSFRGLFFFNFTDCGLYLKSAVREVRGVSRILPAWRQRAKKRKKEKETTKTNVAVHHFPSGCRIQPDQTWHNKHLYLQELYSSFLHLSVQISLSICLKTPVTTGTNMKICSLSLNLFFLYQ